LPPAPRTAVVHVLVNEQADGQVVIHPVTAASFAAYAGEEEAATELGLFLREYFKRSSPAAKSRLALPPGAALLSIDAPLPRDERRREPEIPVTFPCVAVPARAPEPGATLPPVTSAEHDDVWVLVPVLDHALYVERGEDLVETVRGEIRRLLAAQDPSAWDLVGLFPPARARLEALDIPLPDGARGTDAEAQHLRLAERARRKQARAALRAVASPLSEDLRRAPQPPITGRDADLASLRSLLDGKERLGVLLVGPEHAGKSALARAYATESDRAVWATSGAQLIAGMSGLGQWQERVRDVMEAVRELDAVLYFESLDDLLAERVESGGVDLAGAMRPFLDAGQIRVLAEIRSDRLDAAESRHWAFFAGLSRMRVEPLSADLTRSALEKRAAFDARRRAGAVVAADALGPLVDLADRYLPYGAFPGKAMRLYEDLTAAHERDHAHTDTPTVIGRSELYHLFSLMTGVPDFLLRDDAPLRIEDVAAALRKQVIGQEAAILRLAETIGVVKAGLQPRGKPLATFLFIGPTGVGKTELARSLAQLLFGSPDRMIRFDMSEFMTPDAAERLIRGTDCADGLLTRRVREQPFCVLLLDEIEKAHPAVFDLLLQVCGEGRLTDARGRTAYFQNAILIMTSNLGAAERRTPAGFTAGPGPEGADLAHYQRLVSASFRAEFVGRLDRIVPFRALRRAEIHEVARLGVARLALRSGLAEAGCTLTVSPAARTLLADAGYSETYGARAQRRHLDEHLAGPLARLLAGLGGEAKELDLEVTLADEPALGDGAEIARAREGGLDLVARRRAPSAARICTITPPSPPSAAASTST
jgi:ATP-dependent Clp protease ATP-binding subunit ClpC